MLAYEALGCLLGGTLLITSQDGRLMDMPVSMMHGVFPDFSIPGLILLGLGFLNAAGFFSVLGKMRNAWRITFVALGGLVIWFAVEITIIQQVHWPHFMWGLPVLLGLYVAIRLLPSRKKGMGISL